MNKENSHNRHTKAKGSASQLATAGLVGAAKRDVQHQVIRLSDSAWNSFVAALDDPVPETTKKLLDGESTKSPRTTA